MSTAEHAPPRIPSLDGLRAVSILLVLLSHLEGTPGYVPFRMQPLLGDGGNLGVRVFFVISGFLITALLLDEERKTGRVSVGMFYLRRTFRIFPAYYVFLFVVMALAQLGILTLRDGDLLHAFTYTTNYHHDRAWWLGHSWSLAVEEQFYLLWPAAIALGGRRTAFHVALLVIAIGPAVRAATWILRPDLEAGIGEAFPTIADALAAGCVLSFARERMWQCGRWRRFLQSHWFAVVVLAVPLLNRMGNHPLFSMAVGDTLLNVSIALVIERCVRLPDGLSGRFLNARPVVFVGMMSYSIYLWQQLFFDRQGSSWANTFPVNAVLMLVAAISSYYLIEKPSLRLRRSVERRIDEARPALPPPRRLPL